MPNDKKKYRVFIEATFEENDLDELGSLDFDKIKDGGNLITTHGGAISLFRKHRARNGYVDVKAREVINGR